MTLKYIRGQANDGLRAGAVLLALWQMKGPSPYVPGNSPAIGDLFDLFNFGS